MQDYEAACPKLAESYKLEPGTGVLLRLALCYERAGRTASAWTRYLEAAQLEAEAKNQAMVDLATRRAALLEMTLATVTVRTADVAGLDVTLDGLPLQPDARNRPFPVDPGTHKVVAMAPGMRRFVASFISPPTAHATVIEVALVREEDELPPAAVAEPRRAEATSARAASSERVSVKHPWSSQQTTAVVLGGVGAVGLVSGSVFGVWALSSMNTARGQCRTLSSCPARALALQDDARTASTVSTIAFVAGGAAAVGGLLLWFTAPRAAAVEPRAVWRITPSFDGYAKGAVVATSW